MLISTGMGETAKDIRALALNAYAQTVSDVKREQAIDEVGLLIDRLVTFIYGYQAIDDGSVDADDEIINWTLVDVAGDLSGANWSMACGLYKAASSSLRNALDMGMASLYFQARQNINPVKGGYNRFFEEWDSGKRDTPNWGEMMPFVGQQPAVVQFNHAFGGDVVQDVYSHFRDLCSYTHGRAFAQAGGLPTNTMNMAGDVARFDAALFERTLLLIKNTIGWIATIWLVAYPQILRTNPLHDAPDYRLCRALLRHPRGEQAIKVAPK